MAGRDHPVSVLFTPWGEGLVRSWYRRAMIGLSHLPHVRRVAIQTNFSCRPDWLAEADLGTLALWVTYHPGQVAYGRFLAKCRDLAGRGVRFSVGVVGLPEHLDHARRLRADLPAEVYLWVNAAEGHPTPTRRRPTGRRSTASSATAARRTAAPGSPAVRGTA